MIVDHRTYNVHPGKLPEYLEMYKAEGLPLQKKYLGTCVGWYVSMDIGAISSIWTQWLKRRQVTDLSDKPVATGNISYGQD